MSFARILKNMDVFQDGGSWVGQVKSFTNPKLARKLEEVRFAGMDTPVKVDMGGEALEAEFTAAGPMRDVFLAFGGTMGGTMLRFVGAYQDDTTGALDTWEVIVRGRYEEIEMGEAKPGEGGDFKGKLSLAYYRLEKNGAELVEIDPINMVFRVGGIDRLAAQRAALGR